MLDLFHTAASHAVLNQWPTVLCPFWIAAAGFATRLCKVGSHGSPTWALLLPRALSCGTLLLSGCRSNQKHVNYSLSAVIQPAIFCEKHIFSRFCINVAAKMLPSILFSIAGIQTSLGLITLAGSTQYIRGWHLLSGILTGEEHAYQDVSRIGLHWFLASLTSHSGSHCHAAVKVHG